MLQDTPHFNCSTCRSFLSALTVFCTLCLVDTVALYRVAKVFERCFLKHIMKPHSFPRSSALMRFLTTLVGAESLDAKDTKCMSPLIESMSTSSSSLKAVFTLNTFKRVSYVISFFTSSASCFIWEGRLSLRVKVVSSSSSSRLKRYRVS